MSIKLITLTNKISGEGKMGRKKCEEPATCPQCNMNFDGSGRNRYVNLKRHMDTQHPTESEQIPLIHNDHCSNCYIDQSVTVIIGNIEMLEGIQIKQDIVQYITDEIRAGRTLTMMDIFKRAHMNPKYPSNQNIVIPNLSRNEILYKTGDMVKISEIKEGTKVANEVFMHQNIPQILDAMNDGSEKDTFKDIVEQRKTSTKGPSAISTQLKMMSKEERKKVTKNLKNSWNEF